MLRDVAAVQAEAFLADPDGGMRVHGLEGLLRAVGVLAQLCIEFVVHAQKQLGGNNDSPIGVGTGRKACIGSLNGAFGLDRHGR